MIILFFGTTLRNESLRDEYEQANERQREIAEETPGFVSWKQWGTSEGEDIGMLSFESDEGVVAWRDHPDHVAAQKRGQEALYGTYWVRVCELIREADFVSDRAPT